MRIVVKSSQDQNEAKASFQAKMTRNTLKVEQAQFSTQYSEKNHHGECQ